MTLKNLTPEQARKYFEVRLQGQNFARSGENYMARCPFHHDRKASLSLNFLKAGFFCHACTVGGGLVEFEKRFSNCDSQTVTANIAEIIGTPQLSFRKEEPEAIYQYHDEQNRVVLEKLRYPRKRFEQRKPDANGGYEYKLGEIRKPLYHLPEVITANHVIVTEGEKDADRVRALNLSQFDKSGFTRMAVTTNVDGAGKWRPDYNPYFAGENVVLLPDDDDLGRRHTRMVAASVFPYAHSVRMVQLPGLPPKGDVSDYLDGHNAEELVTEIKKAPLWKPPAPHLLVPAQRFEAQLSEEITWLVNGVIQRGSNGFICGAPKGGKSWAAVDLALSLALGVPWLDFLVPQRVKVALVSREDNPALTKWRLRHLLAGKSKTLEDVSEHLWVNSREQSPEFRLDKPEQTAEMLAELKKVKPEFLILDVLNVLHGRDENDNQEMRRILEQLTLIQQEVGCSICVLHHFNKMSEGSMTQRLRGSSAIAGWAEWLVGIEPVPGESGTRSMEFELKAAMSPEPLRFEIVSDEYGGDTRLEKSEWAPPDQHKRPRRRPEDVCQGRRKTRPEGRRENRPLPVREGVDLLDRAGVAGAEACASVQAARLGRSGRHPSPIVATCGEG